MDDVKKSIIRLTHWIDHNLDHLQGYSEMAHILEKRGDTEAAKHIRKGMGLIEEANAAFAKTLSLLARESGNSAGFQNAESAGHEHPHTHAHSHNHTHGDTHNHDHTHEHEHAHEHGSGHNHSHDEKGKE